MMKKVYYSIILLNVFCFKPLVAQDFGPIEEEEYEFTAKEYKKMADLLYENSLYYGAIEHYNHVIEKDSSIIEAFYNAAESYRILRLYHDAAPYYRVVTENKDEHYPLAPFWLGKMYRAMGKYDDAIKSYDYFLKYYSSTKEGRNYIAIANQDIKACQFASHIAKYPINALETLKIDVKNIGSHINKAYSDFGAVNMGEGEIIFASAQKIKAKQKQKIKGFASKVDSANVNRFFKTKKNGGDWEDRTYVDIAPQLALSNIGSASFLKSKQRLYYTICKDVESGLDCRIFYIDRKGDAWGKQNMIGQPLNDVGITSKNPMAIDNEDGSITLYYSTNRKGGEGGFDIWKCKITNDDEIGEPENMGAVINTKDNEVTPYYDKKNDLLYFSSNGHKGLGEFDIFMAKSVAGSYKVQNLGMPINSSADDYYFYLSDDVVSGYFSSNRIGGFSKNKGTCCDDIYEFKMNRAFEYENLQAYYKDLDKMVEEEGSFSMADFFEEEENVFIYGKLGVDNNLPPSTWVYLVDESGMIVDSILSDENGKFNFTKLNAGENYSVMLSADDRGMMMEIDFKDEDGKVLKSISSEETPDFFKFEHIDSYKESMASLQAEEGVFDMSGMFEENDNVFIYGKLGLDGNPPPDTWVYLLDENGMIIDSVKSDKKGKFNFEKLKSGQNYSVMLLEEDQGMFMAIDFKDGNGNVVKTITTDDNPAFFKYETLSSYKSKMAGMQADEGSFMISDFLEEEEKVFIFGKLGADGNSPPGTWVYLMDENGMIVDSVRSDKNGKFNFEKLGGTNNYFVVLGQEDQGMSIELIFEDEDGEELLTLNSDDAPGFFKYEKLADIRAGMSDINAGEGTFDIEMDDFGYEGSLTAIFKKYGVIKYNEESYLEFKKKFGQGVNGLVYKVQVGAYQYPKIGMFKFLKGLPEVKKVKVGILYKFLIGEYTNLLDAEPIRTSAYSQGIKDAFVAISYKGKRVGMIIYHFK